MDMLKHWQELFNTDCDVVKIKNEYLYPIYKCGSTSLLKDAKQINMTKLSSCIYNMNILYKGVKLNQKVVKQ